MVPRPILLSLLSWCAFCQKLDRDSIFTSNSTERPSPAAARSRYPVCYELVNYVTFVVDEDGLGDCKKIADPLTDPVRYIDGPLTYTGTASGDAPFSTTIPASPGGSGHGTVLVFTPMLESLVPVQTLTAAYTGLSAITTPSTTTYTPADGGPPTVLVQTPNDFPEGPSAADQVTVTRQYIGNNPADEPITVTVPGQNFEPDTVIVSIPVPSSAQFTTTTRTGDVSVAATVTSFPSVAGDTGLVVVTVPKVTNDQALFRTITRTKQGEPPSTVTQLPQTPGDVGTVIVQVPGKPETIITQTSDVTAATTLTNPPDFSSGADLVVIIQPPLSTTTRTGEGLIPTTFTQFPMTPGQTAIVVVEEPPVSASTPTPVPQVAFTTITQTAAVATPVTNTQLPTAPGETGTVVVEVPPPLLTTITQTTDVTALTTTTQLPTAPGETGTVIVAVPSPPFTTITQTTDVTALTTTTQLPTAPGETGTVLVQAPPAFTTTTQAADVPAATTFTQSATAPGQTGTVLVRVPYLYTTTTRTIVGSSLTTTTQTATEPGQTGTVLVIAPAPTVTSTTTVDIRSATTTTIQPTDTLSPTVTVQISRPACTGPLRYGYYKFARSGSSTSTSPGQIPFNDERTPNYATDILKPDVLFQGQSARYTGNTAYTGQAKTFNQAIRYDGQRVGFNTEYTAVQHVGYFHPSMSGRYTFTISQPDETDYFWLGPEAVSGYTAQNAKAVRSVNYYLNPVYTYEATADEFVPIRYLHINTAGPSSWSFTVTDPSGRTVVSQYSSLQGTEIVSGCDASVVPNVPVFKA